MTAPSAFSTVRPPAVAGTFYAGNPKALLRQIEDARAQARPVSPAERPGRMPRALIVPHAGFVYSGAVAATAYRLLEGAKGIRRVVLLGPCHRVPVRGLALPGVDAFDTPLGTIAIDGNGVAAIEDLPQVVVSPAAHAREHSLEVQLPFLQRALDDFVLLPLAVGDATAAEVAEVLDRVWGGDETLVVVSSDLSHYRRYDDARRIDAATVRAILAGDGNLDHEQACGATPIAGLLEVARRRGLVPELLDLRNSGDTAGDRSRVVGYASIAFFPPAGDTGADDDNDARGAVLLALARRAVAQAFAGDTPDVPAQSWLREPAATFVTLRDHGDLRGCIGSLEPRRSLADDVVANATAAAFRDPRFAPVRAEELPRLTIEVSLLEPAEHVDFRDRADLVAKLVPGADGVILECGARRATFLPQVWESLPDADAFLDALARKAGIDSAHLAHCRVHRYRVRKWSEGEPR